MLGYLSPQYAAALAEFGSPRRLAHCDGWLLERHVQGTKSFDAMGCYPRFCCHDWSQLPRDLDELGAGDDPPLCVSLVTDPFGNWNEKLLRECFPERCMEFKTHFVVDLSRSLAESVSSHHRYYARVAQKNVRIEEVPDPVRFADTWDALYAHLAERHSLRGLKRFSRESFAKQLVVPGVIAFRAVTPMGQVVGAQLWFDQGEVAYNHLAAFLPEGYALNAGYALYAHSIDYFASRARWLDLGAGAGLDPTGDDGLSRFKRGWSNAARTVYFCGRVLDRARYDEVVRLKQAADVSYFPAYRAGELA